MAGSEGTPIDPLLLVGQIENQVRVAIGEARSDVGTARSEDNIKVSLQKLIKLHLDTFSIIEQLDEVGRARHLENKKNFDRISENIDSVRDYFSADLKRVFKEISNLRNDAKERDARLATKTELASFAAIFEGQLEAINSKLEVLLQQRLG
ncbi:hypothetical protein SAMN05216344_12127 [Polaromonas sp. OV174]|uniref:hypothetical protein n=1 Tax=Polaromonas sp. OV174 TaxID=1855300 RepID=UPI0008EC0920|nr:hypothetical protein [Polaromonas sp. OV174]SFC53772.1 hypothetical protein SAMN05216344_12127 [Polaromonas sp. OV174]